MSGWYSSTVNCYTVTHKSIHQFPTNLHQPSPTFTNLRRPGQRICANVAAHDVRFPANSRRPSTGWPVVQLHDTLPVCWLGKLPTIHPWILWSYWDGLLLDLPTSKMDHIKNNCTLGFLLDHWIIGSHSGRFSGTSNVIHFWCWSSDHEPEELGKMSKSNQQVGFFNNFTHALLSEPTPWPWPGKDPLELFGWHCWIATGNLVFKENGHDCTKLRKYMFLKNEIHDLKPKNKK